MRKTASRIKDRTFSACLIIFGRGEDAKGQRLEEFGVSLFFDFRFRSIFHGGRHYLESVRRHSNHGLDDGCFDIHSFRAGTQSLEPRLQIITP
jgi:hypothetical protein